MAATTFMKSWRACVSKNLIKTYSRSLTSLAPLKADNVEIRLTKEAKPKPDPSNLLFGKNFSDHMLSVNWSATGGWGTPKIHPLEPLPLHPAAKCFHYAVELFEGMKAYRGVDNKIRLFRPMANMERMNSSASRATLPTFDGAELLKLMKMLISIDKEWVPYSTTSTLYIRPTMIGTESSLGVGPSSDAMMFVILGPVGPYYPTGMKPVSLLADPEFVRAWPGGSGFTKMGANYAPTAYVQKIAEGKNCQQVLWLFGENHELTEVGTMNVFMFWTNEDGEKELITPALSSTILPGVTRRSLIDLAKQWGEFKVTERTFTMKDLVKGLNENRVHEMFGAGTACVVCPIERILYQGENLHIPTMDSGAPVTMRFQKELTDIQFGRVESHEWQDEVDQDLQIDAKRFIKHAS
ncbi:branched-chain-amino-acid aminotransferase, cytosolic-like [Lineus longissimus]|uniref:branched-chain-amino-acid aminotransferase, cytosolic-like n=1 Tax=Lineus longissimus TaxID=88925 RepID=UPI002B4CE108